MEGKKFYLFFFSFGTAMQENVFASLDTVD